MTAEPLKIVIRHGPNLKMQTTIIGPFSMGGKPEDLRTVAQVIADTPFVPDACYSYRTAMIEGSDEQRAAVAATRQQIHEDYILAESVRIAERRALEVPDQRGDAILAATREVAGR